MCLEQAKLVDYTHSPLSSRVGFKAGPAVEKMIVPNMFPVQDLD